MKPRPVFASISIGIAIAGALAAVFVAVVSKGGFDLSFIINPFVLTVSGLSGSLAGFWAARRKEANAYVGVSLNALCLLGACGYVASYQWEEYSRQRDQAHYEKWGGTGGISGILVLPDMRIVIVGKGVARLLPDGEADPSFIRAVKYQGLHRYPLGYDFNFDSGLTAMAAMPGGELMIGRSGRGGRIRADGGDATGFDPKLIGTASALAAQSDGRVLGAGVERFFRVHPNGSEDSGFHSSLLLLDATLKVLDNDQIMVSGYVQSSEGWWASFTRLKADGSLDASFHTEKFQMSDVAARRVTAFCVLPDRSLLVARQGTGATEISHLDENGLTVPGFTSPADLWDVRSIVPAGEGKVLIGGGFGVIRVLANGQKDLSFRAPLDLSSVRQICSQGDKILVLFQKAFSGNLRRLKADGTEDWFDVPNIRVYSD